MVVVVVAAAAAAAVVVVAAVAAVAVVVVADVDAAVAADASVAAASAVAVDALASMQWGQVRRGSDRRIDNALRHYFLVHNRSAVPLLLCLRPLSIVLAIDCLLMSCDRVCFVDDVMLCVMGSWILTFLMCGFNTTFEFRQTT